MANKTKRDSVVKIDFYLLEKIDEVIKKDENRYKFINKKQFIDIAVHEFLKKFEEGKRNEK